MSHEFSIRCYEEAKIDPEMQQYEDLENLIQIFKSRDLEQALALPDRLNFIARAPILLIVDDDEQVTDFLKSALVEFGYPEDAIFVCSSGQTAMSLINNLTVDIAFVDIKLGDEAIYVSGLQVVEAIKETSPHSKIILNSGPGTYSMVRRGILELGASYYLQKPFVLADILAITDWALKKLSASGD